METNDLDHTADFTVEPTEEGRYLLTGIDATFPSAGLTTDDPIATIAGIQPVFNRGKRYAGHLSGSDRA